MHQGLEKTLKFLYDAGSAHLLHHFTLNAPRVRVELGPFIHTKILLYQGMKEIRSVRLVHGFRSNLLYSGAFVGYRFRPIMSFSTPVVVQNRLVYIIKVHQDNVSFHTGSAHPVLMVHIY